MEVRMDLSKIFRGMLDGGAERQFTGQRVPFVACWVPSKFLRRTPRSLALRASAYYRILSYTPSWATNLYVAGTLPQVEACSCDHALHQSKETNPPRLSRSIFWATLMISALRFQ